MADWRSPEVEIKVGVSACLLGEEVRYDGGHKREAFVTDRLGRYVTWVPVCPEVEIGLGTPREAIRLVSDPAAPLLVGTNTGIDLTRRMEQELLGLIDDYAKGLVPLVVPITLVNHYVARLDLAYVRDQVYLRPHPKVLRNHV